MNTKIVATIGPASLDFRVLEKMVKAGLDIGRLNTKYGDIAQYELVMSNLAKLNRPLMFDIKGEDLIKWLVTKDFQYLAVSFAETAKQLDKIRHKFKNKPIKIIAKIETGRGIDEIEEKAQMLK